MKMEKVYAIEKGTHRGIITRAEQKKVDFKDGQGPVDSVEIEIQPSDKKDGYRTLPVAVNFSPVLTNLSALGKLLMRLDSVPDDGADFNPRDLEGQEITFESDTKENGFVVVKKDSIRRAAK